MEYRTKHNNTWILKYNCCIDLKNKETINNSYVVSKLDAINIPIYWNMWVFFFFIESELL